MTIAKSKKLAKNFVYSSLVELSKEVNEICTPFFKMLNLNHFNYIHRDEEGKITYLCNNPLWLKHYLSKSYPQIGAFEQRKELSKFKYILWNGLDKNDPILIDSKEILGVEFGITIIKQEEQGFGYYNLGNKSSDVSIINEYVNKIPQYENFICDFQEKASDLFQKAKASKITTSMEIPNSTKKMGYQVDNINFTHKEILCIKYLILGKTANEIAIILNISKRTVETHIKNLKQKLNCFNQFRLGYLLGSMGVKIS